MWVGAYGVDLVERAELSGPNVANAGAGAAGVLLLLRLLLRLAS